VSWEPLADPAWAWAPFEPSAAQPWDLRQAGHLYRRAAFGATRAQLDQALAAGPQRAIDALLEPAADVAAFNRSADTYEAAAASGASTHELRAWWLRRMIETPHPLLERMTLFWHGHFALSNARVRSAQLMADHVQLLRRHALGSFREMFEGVLADPAVYLGLGAQANRRARPNLPFARTLLEQFTLGAGQFTDQDIQAVARAFTGWFVFQQDLRYLEREHDSGPNRLLGRAGDWDARQVAQALLQQPATARRLVRQLYRWLIAEEDPPADAFLEPLAVELARDYQIGRVVETMLRSNAFFSPLAYRQRVKSPVEFAIGLVRSLGATVGTTQLGAALADLGQDLYQPPTVAGWAGHRYWLNRFTVLGRVQLAHTLLATSKGPNGPWDAALAVGPQDRPTAAVPQLLADLFLEGDLAEASQQALLAGAMSAGADAAQRQPDGLIECAARLVATPEYQLS